VGVRALRLAVRVTPQLVRQELLRKGGDDPLPDLGKIRRELSSILAANRETDPGSFLNAVLGLSSIPQRLRGSLQSLDGHRRRLERRFDLYGFDDEEQPIGVVFIAPFGLKKKGVVSLGVV
jgi:hypothetical protein